MPVRYEVRIKNHTGDRIALLDDFEQLAFTHKANGLGSYVLQVGGHNPGTGATTSERTIEEVAALFAEDYQIEVWRRWPETNIAWYTEWAGLHRHKRIWRDGNGWHFLSRGYDYNHLLWRTVVDAYAGESESAKNNAAETVMKEYVAEQMVTRLAFSGVSVQADGANGNNWKGNGMGKRLLDLCADIAVTGGGDFKMVGTGAATFEFRWYTGQLGTDRRASVLFALNYDTMDDPVIEETGDGYNAVLVAGGGTGATRDHEWVTDAPALARSPWNRIEMFRDARDVTVGETSTLQQRGNEEIAAGMLKRKFSFRSKQSAARIYGRNYFVGDLTKASFLGTDYDRKIVGATITVRRDDPEDVVLETIEI